MCCYWRDWKGDSWKSGWRGWPGSMKSCHAGLLRVFELRVFDANPRHDGANAQSQLQQHTPGQYTPSNTHLSNTKPASATHLDNTSPHMTAPAFAFSYINTTIVFSWSAIVFVDQSGRPSHSALQVIFEHKHALACLPCWTM